MADRRIFTVHDGNGTSNATSSFIVTELAKLGHDSLVLEDPALVYELLGSKKRIRGPWTALYDGNDVGDRPYLILGDSQARLLPSWLRPYQSLVAGEIIEVRSVYERVSMMVHVAEQISERYKNPIGPPRQFVY